MTAEAIHGVNTNPYVPLPVADDLQDAAIPSVARIVSTITGQMD